MIFLPSKSAIVCVSTTSALSRVTRTYMQVESRPSAIWKRSSWISRTASLGGATYSGPRWVCGAPAAGGWPAGRACPPGGPCASTVTTATTTNDTTTSHDTADFLMRDLQSRQQLISAQWAAGGPTGSIQESPSRTWAPASPQSQCSSPQPRTLLDSRNES